MPFSGCVGTASADQGFTVSGSNLTANITVTAPTGFEVAKAPGFEFGPSVTLNRSGTNVPVTTVYIRMAAATASPSNGNITCASTAATTQNVAASGTINTLPTITLGTIAGVSAAAMSFSIPYTAVTGSPDQYSVVAGSPTEMPSFSGVSNVFLPVTPISVTIPASAAKTYNFGLTVKNSTTGCVSTAVPVALVVTEAMITTTGMLTAFTACAGSVSGEQSFTVSGSNLTDNITVTAPTGFEVSTTSGSSFNTSATLTQIGGNVANTIIYVRMAATATGTPSGDVRLTSTAATTRIVAASGTVTPNVGTPSFTAGATTLCAGSTSTYTATATNSTSIAYSILNGTGASIDPATGIVSAVTGNFTVVATAAGCHGPTTANRMVTVKPVPAIPTLSGSTEICEGLGTTLLASSMYYPSYYPAGYPQFPITYQWTGGLTGSSIVASPLTTRTYHVAAVYDGCSSDSSAVFTLTVHPKPTKPSITADNLTMCKGQTVVLTGSCATANASFRWTTPPFNSGNQTTALPPTSIRPITEPGIYKGLCESDKGCLSEEVSITINQATDCSGQNFITITPERPAICPGAPITMTATGCTGTLTWIGGATPLTGASVSLSPAATTTYLVQCSTGGSGEFILVVASNTLAVPSNVTTGKERFKAVTTLTSDKKVGTNTFTPGANVIYEAGSSITLLPGFTAEKWSIFKAEIKGCP